MLNAYLPARFTPAERLDEAFRSAIRVVNDRAFYVREDAARCARITADRFASIDGLAMVRRSLADHSAEYLNAVHYASELLEEVQAAGVPFHDGSKRKPVESAAAESELARLSAIIEACTERGEPAPVLVIVAVRNLAMGVR